MKRAPALLSGVLAALLVAPFAEADSGRTGADRAIFGTQEIYSPDVARLVKWSAMLRRWSAERRAATRLCAPGEWGGCEPAEWRRLIDELAPLDLRAKLELVNSRLNLHGYVPSPVNWNSSNYWETPFEFLRKNGQCQDYAIAKFLALRAAGVPNELLRVVVLRDTVLKVDHAVLVVFLGGEALMLDNQIKDVVPVASVDHYRPYYSVNETGWWLHEPNPLEIMPASIG